MIQNYRKIASYVYLRAGVYYFQLRLKKGDFRRQIFKSGLIRKSLKTRDHKEAIEKARFLWSKYMKDIRIFAEDSDFDENMEYLNDLYSRGRVLHKRFAELDPNDFNAKSEFFDLAIEGDGEFSKEFDEEAFKFYANHLNNEIDNNRLSVQSVVKNEKLSHSPNDITLQKAINDFLEDNKNSPKPWGYDQRGKYEAELSFFLQEMGNCWLSELTQQNIRHNYLYPLHKFPKLWKKKKEFFRDGKKLVSTAEIIQITKDKNYDRLSNRTYKGKAHKVETFLKFCADLEQLDRVILNAFNQVKKIENEDNSRIPFSDQQIKKFVQNNYFLKGEWFRKLTFRHWGLLVALYTGGRANEFCQLDIEDVMQDEETRIYYFNLKHEPENDKKLKNKNSRRMVPIHKDLINLGFLNYVQYQKARKKEKLFCELTLDSKGKWHRKLSRWFNEKYLDELGIERVISEELLPLSFHSIRASFINKGKQKLLNERVMQEIVGHASTKATMTDVYANKFNLKTKQKEINKIDYGLDLSKIKKWEKKK